MANDAEFRSYVASMLASSKGFREKYVKVDKDGSKKVTFTPEMFAAVAGEGKDSEDGCDCSSITGTGCSGRMECSDKAGIGV